MKTILIWVGMFLGVFFIVYFFAGRSDTDGAVISGDEYARLLAADKISNVTLEQYGPEQYRVRGKLKAVQDLKSTTNSQGTIKTDKFTTNIVNPEAHIDEWAATNFNHDEDGAVEALALRVWLGAHETVVVPESAQKKTEDRAPTGPNSMSTSSPAEMPPGETSCSTACPSGMSTPRSIPGSPPTDTNASLHPPEPPENSKSGCESPKP